MKDISINRLHFSDIWSGDIEVSPFAQKALRKVNGNTIVGVDPGLTIGLAVATPIQLMFCQTKSIHDAVAFIKSHDPDMLAIEDFVGRGMLNAPMKTTIEYIGAIVNRFEGSVKLFRQQPQLRLSFISDAKILVNDEYMKHAIDATAHTLANLYYVSEK